MRVILKEEALRRSEKTHHHQFIHELPTIEAVPVVHGRWVEHLSFTAFGEYNGSSYECSNCHSSSYDDAFEHFHYCPNCGAKMDGGVSDG